MSYYYFLYSSDFNNIVYSGLMQVSTAIYTTHFYLGSFFPCLQNEFCEKDNSLSLTESRYWKALILSRKTKKHKNPKVSVWFLVLGLSSLFFNTSTCKREHRNFLSSWLLKKTEHGYEKISLSIWNKIQTCWNSISIWLTKFNQSPFWNFRPNKSSDNWDILSLTFLVGFQLRTLYAFIHHESVTIQTSQALTFPHDVYKSHIGIPTV